MIAHPSTCTRFFRRIPVLAVLCTMIATAGAQQVTTRLLSRFLARGEQTIFEIAFSGMRFPSIHPAIPETRGITIRPRGNRAQPRPLANGQFEAVYEYAVSSYEVGRNVIPSLSITADGTTIKTDEAEFTVFNQDNLQWNEATIGSHTVRYAAALRALADNPYEGESLPVEVKLYLPDDLAIEDWGIPDLERDGITSWRFQPSNAISRVTLLGSTYIGMAYPSTLTSTRAGTVSIGPGKVRLITAETVNEGFLRRVAVETNLTLPKLEIHPRPLPEGAPEGFDNAIGDFRITASTTVTEVQEGDPIPVHLTVTGTGNLDNLRPPVPIGAAGWKFYDATPEQRGDERRELSGTVAFSQFLRALEPKPMLPAFRLVYFDPKTSEYKTILTDPIPVKIRPTTAAPGIMTAPPPAAGKIPVEQMNDILGLLPPGKTTIATGKSIPAWVWQIVPAAIAAFLLCRIAKRKLAARRPASPDASARSSDWRELERLRSSADNNTFLLAAGRFIERWFGGSPPPDVAAILAERDARCFRQDATAAETLDARRRKSILHTMRKSLPALPLLVFALILSLGNLRAATTPAEADAHARESFQASRYEEAIRSWLEIGPYDSLSADVLYHIGDACYRADAVGQASLYFRRALLRDPGHAEALQNLRFLDRKYGTITVPRPAYQNTLARAPLATWHGIAWAGAWLCLISLLVFPATRRGAAARAWAIAGLAAAPLLVSAGLLAAHYYPDDSRFAPLAKQAVITAEDVILHTDASRTSPEVITAPLGSLCEVLHTSGKWSYVSFATRTRGWVLTSSFEKLLPIGQPKPPQIRKPKADESSA